MKNGNRVRLFTWKTQRSYIIKLYIFEKYSLTAFEWFVAWCPSKLHQKILIGDVFPGVLLIGNIFESINATYVQKCPFGPTL